MRFKSAAMRPTLRYTSWWIFDHAPQCTVTSTFQLRHVDRLDSMKVPVRLIRHLQRTGGCIIKGQSSGPAVGGLYAATTLHHPRFIRAYHKPLGSPRKQNPVARSWST